MLRDGWNQSPRFLASDVTTRQDLGSISNAREKQNDEGGTGVIRGSSNWMGVLPLGEKNAANDLASGREASLTLSGIKF
jgi:hypothetical protein